VSKKIKNKNKKELKLRKNFNNSDLGALDSIVDKKSSINHRSQLGGWGAIPQPQGDGV
jgi:hypothetical protein